MISLADYVGPHAASPDWTPERQNAAEVMLDKVNAFLEQAEANGVEIKTNPDTGTCVSGQTYGGFRPQNCPQGAPHSSHKEGRAVDIYDPDGGLDKWITDARLEAAGLYREAPSATNGWCHLSDKPPGSGKRTFQP